MALTADGVFRRDEPAVEFATLRYLYFRCNLTGHFLQASRFRKGEDAVPFLRRSSRRDHLRVLSRIQVRLTCPPQ